MKRVKLSLATVAAVVAAFAMQACSSNFTDGMTVGDFYPNALVTVKPVDANSFYLQLDEQTTLRPMNMKGSPYGSKEVRALVTYTEVPDDPRPYDKAVRISWMDSILTKQAIMKAPLEETFYGNDPVEIVKDWVTVVEDGYLTLRFRTASGNDGRIHYVNLVAGQNPDNPYEVEFCHDAQGDVMGDMFDGLVAFKLDCLPDTEGKTVKLLLKWNSFSGPKQVELDYCTRRDSHNPTTAIVDQLPTLKLK